ncbi:hypothetical protein LMH87_002295 [Akanthomyces muscarius]|uniref:Uncharacterized protein n=1 Tax=Akanthomyces muscarius TaxID=2231603 RepID=A0A9W8UIE7_AKAMU|nr:hypothetical protein LMH87_002295 [Akanthomyces muscarius]KAJ4147790.1 hypothetical protein LMH87_002295 [Akanthomyces muscarius]
MGVVRTASAPSYTYIIHALGKSPGFTYFAAAPPCQPTLVRTPTTTFYAQPSPAQPDASRQLDRYLFPYPPLLDWP